jgi:hypothetical protein
MITTAITDIAKNTIACQPSSLISAPFPVGCVHRLYPAAEADLDTAVLLPLSELKLLQDHVPT